MTRTWRDVLAQRDAKMALRSAQAAATAAAILAAPLVRRILYHLFGV